jgi:hypothetical protein
VLGEADDDHADGVDPVMNVEEPPDSERWSDEPAEYNEQIYGWSRPPRPRRCRSVMLSPEVGERGVRQGQIPQSRMHKVAPIGEGILVPEAAGARVELQTAARLEGWQREALAGHPRVLEVRCGQ